MAQFNEKPVDFWVYDTKNGEKEAVIMTGKLIDFCSQKLGYRNYIDINGNCMLVRIERNSIISEAKIIDLKHDIKKYLRDEVKQEKVYAKFATFNQINDHFISLLDRIEEANFNVSKKDAAYFFFNNCIIEVNPSGGKEITYEEFNGKVWKQQINKRSFVFRGNEYLNSEFNTFLKNIAGVNKERHDSIISIIGYLLHPFKDKSFTKCVILLDENIDFTGAAHGGTGKSLIANAIGQITPVAWKDGKMFNNKETFGFDDLRPYHKVLYFDDVKKNFNFEEFYSLITGKLKVNRKYKDSTVIPENSTPKLLISSNYMVKGSGGQTDERRRIEFEVAPYYSISYTPKDEFGHNLFDDWNDEEWMLFDNFMLRCVFFFIRNGVKMPPQINLKENKLKLETDPEFIEFIESEIELNKTIDKAELLRKFKDTCPSQRGLSGITFKKWIDKWADSKGHVVNHYKSNGNALIVVSTRII